LKVFLCDGVFSKHITPSIIYNSKLLKVFLCDGVFSKYITPSIIYNSKLLKMFLCDGVFSKYITPSIIYNSKLLKVFLCDGVFSNYITPSIIYNSKLLKVFLCDGVFSKHINWLYNGDVSLVGPVRDYWQCGGLYHISMIACKLSALKLKVAHFSTSSLNTYKTTLCNKPVDSKTIFFVVKTTDIIWMRLRSFSWLHQTKVTRTEVRISP
jgi:hypothetical protein